MGRVGLGNKPHELGIKPHALGNEPHELGIKHHGIRQ